MADREWLAAVKASKEAKIKSVTDGDGGRFEYGPDKASRFAEGVPSYRKPSNYNSPDESAPQKLGDRNNLRGWPTPDVAYGQDVEDRGKATDKFFDARSVKPGPWGSDVGPTKTGYQSRGPQASHAPGKPSRVMTDNPAGDGPGARQTRPSGDPYQEHPQRQAREGQPATSRMIRGRSK
jgi:hypothetical protein